MLKVATALSHTRGMQKSMCMLAAVWGAIMRAWRLASVFSKAHMYPTLCAESTVYEGLSQLKLNSEQAPCQCI